MSPAELKVGACYSNGAYGLSWGVRLLLKLAADGTVEYKGVAGTCRRKRGHCPLEEFASWARNEVALNENSWHVVIPPEPGT